jgi:hypothetical protein
MKTLVKRPTVNVREDGMSQLEQRELGEELAALAEQQEADRINQQLTESHRQVDGRIGGIGLMSTQPSQQDSSMRMEEIQRTLSHAEAHAETPASVESETRTYIQHPTAFGRLVGRIPVVGKLLDRFDIVQTTDRKVIEPTVDVRKPTDLEEGARDRLYQTRA